MWESVKPIIDMSVRDLCSKLYPNHPKGCPNFGKKEGCPPAAPRITDTLDFAQPVYAIWNRFDFGEHVERMREKHPDWSQRQLECCLYWQGTARKALREVVERFTHIYPSRCVVMCPEAQGVNITETMKQVGVDLEWPPKVYTYQVALAGVKRVQGEQ